MSRVPGVTRVHRQRVKHCSSLIAATWANESEPEDDDNCTVRECRFPRCSAAPLRSPEQQQASTRVYSALDSSDQVPTAAQTPPQPSQRGDRPLKRPRQPFDDITLRQSAENDRIYPRYNPQAAQHEEKTKVNQVGGASSVGRGSITRNGGEPLAPRGARDEKIFAGEKKILPPW